MPIAIGMYPVASILPAGSRRALWAAFGFLGLVTIGAAADALAGLGDTVLGRAIHNWGTPFAYVAAAFIVAVRAVSIRKARAAWAAMAVGLTLYAAGNVLWTVWLEQLPDPPIPSVSDALWLALYPASYLSVGLMVRASWQRQSAGVWLDGIIAGLTIAAIGVALVFPGIIDASEGPSLAVATNLAYPVGDLLLTTLIMGVFALRGWRLDRAWALLGGGFLVLCLADVIYLSEVASGDTSSDAVANIFYLLGVTLLALAAWQPPPAVTAPRTDVWSLLLVPNAFIVGALAVLMVAPAGSGVLARALALAAVGVAMVRTALTLRDVQTLTETRRQALTDDLTGLPNRREFMRKLERAATGRRSGIVALLLIDLDHFKELNDTLGHHAGDQLLRQIGPRLEGLVRPGDTLARLGGDEFAVIAAPVDGADDARAIAARVGQAIATPFFVEGISLRVGASVGIALYPDHAQTAGDLLRLADVAMYQAKANHNDHAIYSPTRDIHSRARLALLGELERALEGDEILLHYQPKADSRTREIVGAEALVRWSHPELGLLMPDAFIHVADQSGLSRALTRRVIRLALAQLSDWRSAGYGVDQIAVNVMVADLLDATFPAEVAEALAEVGLDASDLVIEITETSVLSDPQRIGAVLADLNELGVALSLDDFGTGYSSLTHLRTLPVTEVKIDRSFVGRMEADPADAALVEAAINLTRALGMRVVAEGVEDEATWQRLAAAGCEHIQGFYLSCPKTPADLEPMLSRERVPAAR